MNLTIKTEGTDKPQPSLEGSDISLETPTIKAKMPRLGAALDRLFSIPVEHLGDRVEAWFDKNAADHLNAIREERKKENIRADINIDNIDVNTIHDFRTALLSAAEFDMEKNPELSAAWRAALNDCLNQTNMAGETIHVLQSTPRRALVKFFQQPYAQNKYELPSNARDLVKIFSEYRPRRKLINKDLENAGLIELKMSFLEVIAFLTFSILIIWYIYTIYDSVLLYYNIIMGYVQPETKTERIFSNLSLYIIISLVPGLFSLYSMYRAFYHISSTYILTPLGLNLMAQYEKFK